MKDFATGEVVDFAFKNGVRQPYPSRRGSKDSNRPTTCYTNVTCYWSGYCAEGDRNGNIVYGTITMGVNYCGTPGDDGVGCARIAWTRTGSSSGTYCDGGGTGYDPGSGPTDPGGCTTCSGPVTPINPNSPCGQMATLATMPGFQLANAQAIAMTQGSVEYGAAYRNGGNAATDYIPFSGGPSNARWPRATGWQYDGMLHTHPDGYSVFSISDLGVMYNVADEGYMHDPTTFSMIVYTTYGDDYALKINNYSQFLAFGAKISDVESVRAFERAYVITYPPLYPFEESRSTRNEQSLLRIMRDFNTGLSLLKHDRTTNKWEPLVLGPSDIPVTNPCQ